MVKRDWLDGNRAAYKQMMDVCILHLGAKELKSAQLASELEDVRRQLRMLSEDLGCNDWPDDLHLGDVIEKYVARAVADLLDETTE